ncbi:molybdopterin molybdotransferase MoeA [Brevibacillus migulae]|uniref:molybdopterin molybdotransferase MoeA n=1 Tax=Brevibacillus migulae TaxID=1644114 RepID=UPI00106E4256|nr:gephyrin-like molybdotransferase Glp [Brevibacillus migulae]
MRFRRETISVEEARERLLARAMVMPQESIDWEDAVGRIVATDLHATCALPPFDRSAMDGYAVRSADTAGASPEATVTLRVVETVLAGDVPRKQLGPGEAARIMTGGMIPAGADCVIMFEQTVNPGEVAETVALKKAGKPGENIIKQAEEVAEQQIVLKKGERINPGTVAVLATFGYVQVPVIRKPRIGILSTGNELVGADQPLVPGKIRDSNTPMLSALIREAGGIPVRFPRLPDEYGLTVQEIETAMAQVDVLITTGGVSVGDMDMVAAFVDRDDVELLFNRVAMRPGSPTTAAAYQGKLLCGLSGNPGACYIGFELFIRPLLYKLTGKPHVEPRQMQAILASDYLKPCPYPRYLRGKLSAVGSTLYAYPDALDKSAPLSSLKDTECLIVIPAGGRGLQANETVTVIPTGWVS